MTLVSGARPARGVVLDVTIGHSETVEWNTDADYRAATLKDFVRRAHERGRKFIRVRDANGHEIHFSEAG